MIKNNMRVITVATVKKGYFHALEKSCNDLGYTLTVLGLDQPWTGLTMKFRLVKDHIKDLPPDEIIIFVDAFDVIFLKHSSELKKKLQDIPHDKILFGKDNYYLALSMIYGSPTFSDPVKGYINSGVYIGRSRQIYALLEKICIETKCHKNLEDQYLLNNYQKHHRDDSIMIDFDSSIIYNFAPRQSLSIIERFLHNKRDKITEQDFTINDNEITFENNISPVIIHGNGNTDMDILCEILKLPLETQRNFHNYNGWRTIRHIMLRKVLFIFHILFAIFYIGFPTFIWICRIHIKPLFLMMYIILCHIIVLQWYLIGNCICHDMEQDYSYDSEQLFFEFPFLPRKFSFYFFSLIPLFNIIFTMYLLSQQYPISCNMIYRRSIKKKL